MTNSLTITYRGVKTRINGLPDEPVREWDKSIKIKFYDRGKNTPPTITRGRLKFPRSETQLYINNKYFLQFPEPLTQPERDEVQRIFIYLYRCGCDLEEIKRLFKASFYQGR